MKNHAFSFLKVSAAENKNKRPVFSKEETAALEKIGVDLAIAFISRMQEDSKRLAEASGLDKTTLEERYCELTKHYPGLESHAEQLGILTSGGRADEPRRGI